MFGLKNKSKKEENGFIGRIRPYKGHSLFKINKETLEVFKVDFNSLTKDRIQEKGLPVQTKRKKLIVEEGFFYLSALNFKNVQRKLTRAGMLSLKSAN